MMKFESKRPFTAEQKVWLIQVVLRDGISKAEAWRQLTGEHTGRPADVPASDIAYKPFCKRMAKLVGTNIDKIQPAGGTQSEPDDFNPSPIDISSLDGQILWLERFISDNTSGAKPGDRLRAITTLQEWQERLKPPTDGRILLANPNNVKLDVGHLTQMLFICREEVGGLHNLDYRGLNSEEIELLIKTLTKILEIRAANDINFAAHYELFIAESESHIHGADEAIMDVAIAIEKLTEEQMEKLNLLVDTFTELKEAELLAKESDIDDEPE